MSRKFRITLLVFLSVEGFLYWDMMSLDLLQPGKWFQYLSILLCWIFLFLFPRKTKGWITVTVGMGFAVLADLFLVVLQSHQVLATSIFVGTQSAFAIRLFWEDGKRRGSIGALRVILFVGLEIAGMLVVGQAFDGLIFVTLLYFSLLLGNIVHALFIARRFPLFAIGLILFAACDVFVGLGEAGPYLSFPSGSWIAILLDVDINWAWLFYLPAQVLVTLSVYRENPVMTPLLRV